MNQLRIVIADDERPAREFLKSLLRAMEGAEVVGEAENGMDAVDLIKELKPDLALLDLQMPEVSGLEAVRLLRRSQMPLVAFVTAYNEYAVEAFELNAIDYLLKPVEKSRLAATLQRASERLEQADWRERETDRLKEAGRAFDEAARHEPLTRIPVKKREEIFLVPVSEVATITADGELLHLTTTKAEKYTINYRLKDIELRLNEEQFIRLSRSAIANVDMIERVSPMPGGTYLVTMKNGQEITSSRLQSKMLRTKLLKL